MGAVSRRAAHFHEVALPQRAAWLATLCGAGALLLVLGPCAAAFAQERAVLQEKGEVIRSLACSPDGKYLAWGGSGSPPGIQLWDLAKNKLDNFLPHQQAVNCVAFSPDGRLLAAATSEQSVRRRVPLIVIWDMAARKELTELEGGGITLAFSPDGKTLVSGAMRPVGNRLKVWDVATGKERKDSDDHKSYVCAVAFAPDGQTFASGCYAGTVIVWDAHTLTPLHRLTPFQGEILSLAYAPDSRTLVVGSTHGAYVDGDFVNQKATLKLHEVYTGKVRWAVKPSIRDMAGVTFSPDGKLLALGGDRHLEFLEAATGERWALLKSSSRKQACGLLAFTPDGKTVVTSDSGGCVKVWDVPKVKQARSDDDD